MVLSFCLATKQQTMSNLLQELFGHGKNLNALQMSCRGVVTFFLALVLIRIAGRRSFGMKSAFDNIIALLLGAVLSRAVVGASPFIPTTCTCTVIAILHRGFAWLSIHSKVIGTLVKGNKILIYENGQEKEKNMKRSLVSDNDLKEELRLKMNADTLDDVKTVYMERNGELSFIEKKDDSYPVH